MSTQSEREKKENRRIAHVRAIDLLGKVIVELEIFAKSGNETIIQELIQELKATRLKLFRTLRSLE